MDHASQQLFDELVRKQPHELSETDIAFLNARSFYLTEDHKKVFGKVLGIEKAETPASPAKKEKK